MFRMLYAFIWVIPWCLNFVCPPIYSVIQTYGLNFVSLYFKFRTTDNFFFSSQQSECWVLYELMCWLATIVVRSPPARRFLSWVQSLLIDLWLLVNEVRNEYVEEKLLQTKKFKCTWIYVGGYSHTPAAEAGNIRYTSTV
jgi:hypothetical protein